MLTAGTVKLELMNTSQIPGNDAVLAYLNAHFRPDVAADLLAAAEPLMAIAWDEGEEAGQGNADSNRGFDVEPQYNPYRITK